MNRLQVLRSVATAALTGLAVTAEIYPHLVWVPIVYAVAGTLGIHAIPSIGQNFPKVGEPK